jgi:hypothetical protein
MKVIPGKGRRRPSQRYDLPWLGANVLVLTSRAVEALGDVLSQSGELLPLACSDAELYVFNPLQLVDALDEEASELVRFESGRVMAIDRYVFKPGALGDAKVFNVPQLAGFQLYTTRELVDAVAAAGLHGTEFVEIWCDDSPTADPTPAEANSAPKAAASGGDQAVASHPTPQPNIDGEMDYGPVTPTEVFLRGVWTGVIPQTVDVSWVTQVATHPLTDEPLGDYGSLIKRMLDAGLSPAEIARFAQLVGYETVFSMCVYLEDSQLAYVGEPDNEEDQLEWGLFTVDRRGRPLEAIQGLHEEVLSADPSGREMRP